MKKQLLVATAVVAVVLVAAGGWFLFLRPHDPLALARNLMAKGDLRGSQLALRNALQSSPDNAEAHFRLGQVQLRLGDPVAAERELTIAQQRGWKPEPIRAPMAQALLAQQRPDEVLKISPDGLPADQQTLVLVARSTADLALKRPADAAREAVAATAAAPQSIDARMAVANAAEAQKDTATEEKAVEQSLAIDPHAPGALLLRADLLAARGDRAGALAAVDAAVAAAPDMAAARLHRADLLIAARENVKAGADVDAVLAQQPRNPLALMMRAEVLAQQRDFRGADQALQLAGPALARIPFAIYLQGLVKGMLNEPEQGLDAVNRYIAAVPADPAGYILAGRLYLLAQRPAEAADLLNRAMAAGHGTPDTLAVLSAADLALGRATDAVSAMQQAASLAPHDPILLARLATLKLGTGDAGAAVADLQHLLDILPAKASTDAAGTQPGNTSAAPGPSTEQARAALVAASIQAGDLGRAQATLDSLRADHPQPGLADSLDGLIRMAKLDFSGAQAAFEAAGRAAPQDFGVALNLARALAIQGKNDEAAAILTQAAKQNPGNVPLLTALVAADVGQNRLDAAAAALESARAAAPDNPQIAAGLADIYTRMKQPQKALDVLDPMIATAGAGVPDAASTTLPPALPLGLDAKIRALVAAGRTGDAVDAARRLVTLQPRNAPARRTLAGLLVAGKRYDEAEATLREGLAQTPGNPALMAADVSLATQQGGLTAGLARADELGRDTANLPNARLLRAEAYIGQQKYAEAAGALQAVMADPGLPGTATRAALAYAQAGQPDKGAALLRDWLAAHPNDADAAGVLGSLDISAHRLDDAKSRLQAVLAQRPNDAASLNNLAWIAQQQNDPGTAEQLARRSWTLAPRPQTADTLGWILVGAGQPQQALDLLRNAAAALPDDPGIQYHYGAALQKAGQPDKARPILAALAQRQAAFPEQEDARRLLQTLGQP